MSRFVVLLSLFALAAAQTTVSNSGAVGTTQGVTPAPTAAATSSNSGGTTQAVAATTQALPAGSTLVYFGVYSNTSQCNAGVPLYPVSFFTPQGTTCQTFTAINTGSTTIYDTAWVGQQATGAWLTANIFTGSTCAAGTTVGQIYVQNNVCSTVTVLGQTAYVKAWWTPNVATTGLPAATTGSSAGATVSVGLATLVVSLLAALLL